MKINEWGYKQGAKEHLMGKISYNGGRIKSVVIQGAGMGAVLNSRADNFHAAFFIHEILLLNQVEKMP
jgi:sulfite exporter TauE/SafE